MSKRTVCATVGVASALVAASVFTAVPANAENATESPIVGVSEAQLTAAAEADPQTTLEVDALIAAFDTETKVLDERSLSAEVLASQTADAFATEVVAGGGSVVALDGTVSVPIATQSKSSSTSAAAAGSAWLDGWGYHMTMSSDVIDRVAALAATGSTAAGGIAALLAINIEGFPVSTTGALAAGAVAVALIASAGIMQACNLGGKGAQVNYNWVIWTCWPL